MQGAARNLGLNLLLGQAKTVSSGQDESLNVRRNSVN